MHFLEILLLWCIKHWTNAINSNFLFTLTNASLVRRCRGIRLNRMFSMGKPHTTTDNNRICMAIISHIIYL
ncbi:hypothetical protein HZS_7099 [Henneguya salminicola]|nr:hypothetical protein HZS_7099 [Henneguya salminicola]